MGCVGVGLYGTLFELAGIMEVIHYNVGTEVLLFQPYLCRPFRMTKQVVRCQFVAIRSLRPISEQTTHGYLYKSG